MRYNEAHFKIQTVIQKTFGALKSRFRCLDNLGSIQKNNCSTHVEVVSACCVLHNIAMKFSVPFPEEFVPEPGYHGVNREEITQSNSSMLLFREDMIKAFFPRIQILYQGSLLVLKGPRGTLHFMYVHGILYIQISVCLIA
uniref:DDE Tnp4 domain-containing protein n=1 Tax=Anguilla anguilla TaxID=7936 RepID=A0A0E9WPB6_ANGAN